MRPDSSSLHVPGRAVLSVTAAIDNGEWRMRLVRINELRRGGWHTGSAA